MPVRVQCPDCESVFGAPDAARGKAVACRTCGGRVPVPRSGAAPGGGGGQKRPQPAQAQRGGQSRQRPQQRSSGGGGDDFMGVDLRRAEDTSRRICPNPECKKRLSPEESICPKCGTDLATGQLTDKARKLKERGGPDPDRFFKYAFKEPWSFAATHWDVCLRTGIYTLIGALMVIASYFGVRYSVTLPPKAFCYLILGIFALMPVGWLLHLTIEIIKLTVKKEKHIDRVHYSFFGCAAGGLRVLGWWSAFWFGLPIMAIVFVYFENLAIAGWVLIGVFGVLSIPFLAAALPHFAMPVELRGWFSPFVMRSFFRAGKACSVWLMTALAGLGPLLLCAGLCLIWKDDLSKYFAKMDFNHRVELAKEQWPQDDKWQFRWNIKASQMPDNLNNDPEIEKAIGGFDNDKQEGARAAIKEMREYMKYEYDKAIPVTEAQWETMSHKARVQARLDPVFWWRHVDKERGKFELDHAVWIGPGIIILFCCFGYGFTIMWPMRAGGMLTYYFAPELELDTLERQATWNADNVIRASDEEYARMKSYASNANTGIVLGSLGSFAFGFSWYAREQGWIKMISEGWYIAMLVGLGLMGTVGFVFACYNLAVSKNLPPVMALVGMLNIVGLIVMIAIPVKMTPEMIAAAEAKAAREGKRDEGGG